MSIYRCPVCEQPLTRHEKHILCPNGHSFDIARQSYVNLLLPNQKNSPQPGDSKDMLLSRREFLNRGFYDLLSDELNQQINQVITGQDDVHLLDVGCGEGFYLRRLRDYLATHQPNTTYHLYGTDISKPGVRYAAGRDRASQFFVASLYQLPVQNQALNSLIRVFAPKAYPEFARVLKPDGVLVSVVPAPDHLIELKRLVYQTPQKHQLFDDPERDPYFTLHDRVRVTYTVNLPDTDAIFNLLRMTPYYWHLSDTARDTIQQLSNLQITVDCQINSYAVTNAPPPEK